MHRQAIARGARVVLACAFFSFAAQAQQVSSPMGDTPRVEIRAEPEVQPQPAFVAAPKVRLASPSQVAHVMLAPPALAAVEKSVAPAKPGVPLQIGFGRPVAELESAAQTVALLRWAPLEGGRQVAAFSITSTDAAAVRAGLMFDSLPAHVSLRFYAPGEGDVFEVSAEEVQETIGRNLNAGEQGDAAHTYWSPIVEGATVVVEIELPAGVSARALRIAAPVVSHLVTSPQRNFAMPSTKAAASCNLDVMCYSAWSNESSAVARIAFTDGGSSFLCSGTLLVDLDTATSFPYFLTANHCVSSQASASSLQSYWFYRSSACNSGVRGASQTLVGGATLLYNSTATDTSFLLLNSTPPAGAVYAGWRVGGAPPAGASVAGIHHPQGDLQKISMGTVGAYASCSSTSAETFDCHGATFGGSTFYEIDWSSGITEPGSSGSGVFLENGHYLMGQLYGGTEACGTPGSDFYGRFDVAYNERISQYLNGGFSGTIGSSPRPTVPPSTPSFVPALDYSALWWNPAESGWGLSLTQHNATLFAAWFIYGTGGTSTWVVMPGGTWTSPTSITGDVYSTSGSPSNAAFDPAQSSTLHVGTATLTFTSADVGTLTYAVNGIAGSKSIQRQQFGIADATPVASYGDLWWNAAESGSGLSINQQYRTLFAVWYTYGIYGQPVWYVLPGGSWSGDTYAGTLYRTATLPIQFLNQPFDPRTVQATAVGSMALRFGSTSAATMSYTVDGVSGAKPITRQPF
jgi:lysyl endopeptidase